MRKDLFCSFEDLALTSAAYFFIFRVFSALLEAWFNNHKIHKDHISKVPGQLGPTAHLSRGLKGCGCGHLGPWQSNLSKMLYSSGTFMNFKKRELLFQKNYAFYRGERKHTMTWIGPKDCKIVLSFWFMSHSQKCFQMELVTTAFCSIVQRTILQFFLQKSNLISRQLSSRERK